MRKPHAVTRLLCLFALLCSLAAAQNSAPQVKHFSDKGLSFDYPSDWTLTEQSQEGGQKFIVHQGDGALIMVLSRFEQINSQEQLETARRDVADKFTDEMFGELKKRGEVERKDSQAEVAGVQARGTRLRAVLAGEPGAIEVYSLLLGKRLVMVSIIGTDKESAVAASAWALVRSSLRVAADAASTRGATHNDAASLSSEPARPRT